MFDVLEHIEDDCATLSNLKRKLSDNGHIFITVPAYNWLWSEHDEINHHKRRYSKYSLDLISLLNKTIINNNCVFIPPLINVFRNRNDF